MTNLKEAIEMEAIAASEVLTPEIIAAIANNEALGALNVNDLVAMKPFQLLAPFKESNVKFGDTPMVKAAGALITALQEAGFGENINAGTSELTPKDIGAGIAAGFQQAAQAGRTLEDYNVEETLAFMADNPKKVAEGYAHLVTLPQVISALQKAQAERIVVVGAEGNMLVEKTLKHIEHLALDGTFWNRRFQEGTVKAFGAVYEIKATMVFHIGYRRMVRPGVDEHGIDVSQIASKHPETYKALMYNEKHGTDPLFANGYSPQAAGWMELANGNVSSYFKHLTDKFEDALENNYPEAKAIDIHTNPFGESEAEDADTGADSEANALALLKAASQGNLFNSDESALMPKAGIFSSMIGFLHPVIYLRMIVLDLIQIKGYQGEGTVYVLKTTQNLTMRCPQRFGIEELSAVELLAKAREFGLVE